MVKLLSGFIKVANARKGDAIIILNNINYEGLALKRGEIHTVNRVSKNRTSTNECGITVSTRFLTGYNSDMWIPNYIWQPLVKRYKTCKNCESSCRQRATCVFFSPLFSKVDIEYFGKMIEERG